MADINKLIEELGKLTMQEAADLGTTMEKKWGINYSDILNSNAAPVAAESTEAVVKDIWLTSFGEGKKILVLKAIRSILGLGLNGS